MATWAPRLAAALQLSMVVRQPFITTSSVVFTAGN